MDNKVYLIGYISDAGVSDTDEDTLCTPIEIIIEKLYTLHRELPEKDPIVIYMSTEGGDSIVASALQSVISTIRRTGRKINCHVMGYAYSSGFDILQVCDRRSMEPFAALMTHESRGGHGSDDSSGQTLVEAEHDKAMERVQFEILARRTGMPASFYQRKVKNGSNWYILAPEAKKLGLIDEITQIPEFHKSLAQLPKKRITKKKKLDDNHQEPT